MLENTSLVIRKGCLRFDGRFAGGPDPSRPLFVGEVLPDQLLVEKRVSLLHFAFAEIGSAREAHLLHGAESPIPRPLPADKTPPKCV